MCVCEEKIFFLRKNIFIKGLCILNTLPQKHNVMYSFLFSLFQPNSLDQKNILQNQLESKYESPKKILTTIR